jgi:hypothetical protein
VLAAALVVTLVCSSGCILGQGGEPSLQQKLSSRLTETVWASVVTEISEEDEVGVAVTADFKADGTMVIWDMDHHTADWEIVSDGDESFTVELSNVERSACDRDCGRPKPAGVSLVRQVTTEIKSLEIEFPSEDGGRGTIDVFPVDRSDVTYDQVKGTWLGSLTEPGDGSFGEVYVKLRFTLGHEGSYSYGPTKTAGKKIYENAPSYTVRQDDKDYWLLVPSDQRGKEDSSSNPLAGQIDWADSASGSTIFAPYIRPDSPRRDRLGSVELSHQ